MGIMTVVFRSDVWQEQIPCEGDWPGAGVCSGEMGETLAIYPGYTHEDTSDLSNVRLFGTEGRHISIPRIYVSQLLLDPVDAEAAA